MKFAQSLCLDGKEIGLGKPIFIVAEIGINHNGSLELAKKTILAAKESGADSVKFQNYKTEDFIIDRAMTHTFTNKGASIEMGQYDMFKKYELKDEQIIILKKFCDDHNIIFHSTPTSEHGIELLKRLQVPILKNGSDFLTHKEILMAMAKSQLPTVLSTGMAKIQEIESAVEIFKKYNNDKLILLHCTSSYPCPANKINLKKIKTLNTTFGPISGFSDHSEGIYAAVSSVHYGAGGIEKHFTIDRNLEGPDHSFSLDPKDMKLLCSNIRNAEKAIGEDSLGYEDIEINSRQQFTLKCFAKKDIAIGEKFSMQNVCFARSNIDNSIPASMINILEKLQSQKNFKQNEIIIF